MWVASTDYFDDVRIGKEVLAGTTDAYRKLRNTFRYLLGALDGFTDAERLDVNEMPELERYMLHLLAELDTELRDAANGFEFNRYIRAITDFANNDLSRSEEHTSELQSLMRISYAVFCLKKKIQTHDQQ